MGAREVGVVHAINPLRDEILADTGQLGITRLSQLNPGFHHH